MELVLGLSWLLALALGASCVWLWQRVVSLEASLAQAQAESRAHAERTTQVVDDRNATVRRIEARAEESARRAHVPVVRDLVPVLDSFDAALGHHEGEQSPLVDGVRMVKGQLESALSRHGLEIVDARGATFDPNLHEAIDLVESPEHQPGTVIRQWGRGFLVHGQLIRPAQVVLAKEPAAGVAPVEE